MLYKNHLNCPCIEKTKTNNEPILQISTEPPPPPPTPYIDCVHDSCVFIITPVLVLVPDLSGLLTAALRV